MSISATLCQTGSEICQKIVFFVIYLKEWILICRTFALIAEILPNTTIKR